MAQALARRIDVNDLEDNGIVRSAVFPNAMRDVRRRRGFPTLRAFDGKVDVTYTRLAKIERGEIVPEARELTSIAAALEVPVGKLLVDPASPEFNREQWAREHIEAKLQNRGGGIDAMLVGAAVRVKRCEMGKSTTHMKSFGLPAATCSRIENADRPVERWDAETMRGIAKVLGCRPSAVKDTARRMFEAGELDKMLQTLFSPEAIEERNSRKLRALLSELPGTKAAKMLQDLNAPVEVQVLGTRDAGEGCFKAAPSDRKVEVPHGSSRATFAVEMASPVIGPGLPKGCVVVADPHAAVSAGDVAVIRDGDNVRVMIVAETDGKLVGVSMVSPIPVTLTDIPEDVVVAKMVSTVF